MELCFQFIRQSVSVVQGNKAMARDVLLRVLQLGFGVGVLIGAAILLTRNALPLLFTNDPAVQAIAASTLPVLGVLMVSPHPSRLWIPRPLVLLKTQKRQSLPQQEDFPVCMLCTAC